MSRVIRFIDWVTDDAVSFPIIGTFALVMSVANSDLSWALLALFCFPAALIVRTRPLRDYQRFTRRLAAIYTAETGVTAVDLRWQLADDGSYGVWVDCGPQLIVTNDQLAEVAS